MLYLLFFFKVCLVILSLIFLALDKRILLPFLYCLLSSRYRASLPSPLWCTPRAKLSLEGGCALPQHCRAEGHSGPTSRAPSLWCTPRGWQCTCYIPCGIYIPHVRGMEEMDFLIANCTSAIFQCLGMVQWLNDVITVVLTAAWAKSMHSWGRTVYWNKRKTSERTVVDTLFHEEERYKGEVSCRDQILTK